MHKHISSKVKDYKPILKQIINKHGIKCIVYDNKFFAYGELYTKNKNACKPKQK